jgi:competence protein ComEC
MVVRRRLLGSVAAAVWLVAVHSTLLPSRHGAVEIHVLDVGQGDAIAIRSPHGRWILIDAGPRTPGRDAGSAVVLPFFRRQGVRGLEVLIATHPDADHLGGVPAVLRALNPQLLIENGQPVGSRLFLEHLAAIDAQGTPWRAGRAGDTLVVDSVTLAILHPTGEWLQGHPETNENSIVVRLTYRSFDALLTGDTAFPAESALIARVAPSEILKIGHHGSAGGTGSALLDAVSPTVAVISVGENRYGHPAPSVLDRLGRAGVAVRRTDQGGTVTIGRDGHTFWVRQERRSTFGERLRCLREIWLPSSVSSSSRSVCTAKRRESYPTFSTTSPSRPR